MLIRAYNLVPGAGFRIPDTSLFGHVVTKVSRDIDLETVTVRTHDGRVFGFDFCTEVELVGLDANLGTEEDVSDLGTEWSDQDDVTEAQAFTDAQMDESIMALVALGFGPDDTETNEHVAQLHRVLLEVVGLEDLSSIIRPPAHP